MPVGPVWTALGWTHAGGNLHEQMVLVLMIIC
jgi:hypothetical protein